MSNERPPINGFRVIWQVLGTLLLVGAVVAIMFPVYTDSVPISPRTSCLSNIKQLTAGVMMYSADNEDTVSPYFSFDGEKNQEAFIASLLPYVKHTDLFLCPKEQKDIRDNGVTGGQDYVHCLVLRGVIPEFATGKRLLKLTSLKDPGAVPYLRDPIRGYGTTKNNPKTGFLSPHGNSFVTSYLDGHSKFESSVDLNTDL
jgi:hypothetical protein